ncbi:MAG TPA: hypothetical protein DCS13_04665 [Candidatus Margulisbacteria bacterium]|nr:MAG: hypothetical protein A2X43_00510 [Candidatus Margulisbacteria bacterium GWD2_39_127]HAR62736.1 hypothetical protein [Candidatus Margulisiibacteriota bacterium]
MAKKILLIDDSPYILRFIGSSLQNNGYEVLTAENAYDGIERAIKAIPDLIIMDLKMPNGNGIDACISIRTAPETCHIPIILASAHINELVIKDIHLWGINDYIRKPFTPHSLTEKIVALMR